MFEPGDLLGAACTPRCLSPRIDIGRCQRPTMLWRRTDWSARLWRQWRGTRRPPGTPTLLAALAFSHPCPCWRCAEATEGESSSSLGAKEGRGGSARGGFSPRLLHRLHRYQNRGGNKQYKLMKSKPFKGNKLFRNKTFSVDGLRCSDWRTVTVPAACFFRANEFASHESGGWTAEGVGLLGQRVHLLLSDFSQRAKLKADKLLSGERKENKRC